MPNMIGPDAGKQRLKVRWGTIVKASIVTQHSFTKLGELSTNFIIIFIETTHLSQENLAFLTLLSPYLLGERHHLQQDLKPT